MASRKFHNFYREKDLPRKTVKVWCLLLGEENHQQTIIQLNLHLGTHQGGTITTLGSKNILFQFTGKLRKKVTRRYLNKTDKINLQCQLSW